MKNTTGNKIVIGHMYLKHWDGTWCYKTKEGESEELELCKSRGESQKGLNASWLIYTHGPFLLTILKM